MHHNSFRTFTKIILLLSNFFPLFADLPLITRGVSHLIVRFKLPPLPQDFIDYLTKNDNKNARFLIKLDFEGITREGFITGEKIVELQGQHGRLEYPNLGDELKFRVKELLDRKVEVCIAEKSPDDVFEIVYVSSREMSSAKHATFLEPTLTIEVGPLPPPADVVACPPNQKQANSTRV